MVMGFPNDIDDHLAERSTGAARDEGEDFLLVPGRHARQASGRLIDTESLGQRASYLSASLTLVRPPKHAGKPEARHSGLMSTPSRGPPRHERSSRRSVLAIG